MEARLVRRSEPCHDILAVVLLGQESVVGPAHERQVGRAVVAAAGEGVLVVKLEIVALGAAEPVLVPVGAATEVTLVHQSPHRGGDVT